MTDFSCDLVEESRKHVRFLEGLHADGTMLTPVSPRSLNRYINCWLHLVAREVADNETIQLIPPPDVAWIWHCHRLAPMNYDCYVRKRFETLLEASPSFSFQREVDDNNTDAFLTRDSWYNAFPDEPFFLQDTEDFSSDTAAIIVEQCRSLEGFDLVSSTQNQAAFLWQVSGPKFREDEFLHAAVENYHKFLKLSSTKKKSRPLVPTYQIDLMWHTHMLWSLRGYHLDCMSIRGEMFHHDDSLNDRRPEGTLDLAFQATKELWEKTYNQDYIVDGGMYRGEPPLVYYDVPAWQLALTTEAIGRALERPIAAEAGASSTGKSAPRGWLDPKSDSCDDSGHPIFIAANARSKRVGVNSNEKKDGYIFGAGTAGNGYYALCTRDAYKILDQRVSRQVVYAERTVNNYTLGHCLCWCAPSEEQRQEIERLEMEIEKVRALKKYVRARHASNDPYTAIAPFYSNSGATFVYPTGDMCMAGGCGGALGDLCVAGGCGGGDGGGGGCG
jgi:hypothetical protein